MLGGGAGAHATEHDAEGEHRQRQEDDRLRTIALLSRRIGGRSRFDEGYVKGAECGTP